MGTRPTDTGIGRTATIVHMLSMVILITIAVPASIYGSAFERIQARRCMGRSLRRAPFFLHYLILLPIKRSARVIA